MKNLYYLLFSLALTLLVAGCSSAEDRAARQQEELDAQNAKIADDFDKAVNRAPTANTLYAMARVLALQHRDADCQIVLTKIIAEHPDYLPAYNDLAELQLRQRALDDAIVTLEGGLKRASHEHVLLNNLGMCYLLKGDYEAALPHFIQATALAPHNTRYRANLAVVLGMLGRYDESLALYLQIAAPTDAHYNLAVLARQRSDTARADNEFTIAQKLKESTRVVKE